MKYDLKLRTGFFTSEVFHLSVSKNLVILEAKNSGSKTKIPEEEIQGITLTKKHRLEIEFSTKDRSISGVFIENTDPKDIFDLFIDNLKTPTTYKEE